MVKRQFNNSRDKFTKNCDNLEQQFNMYIHPSISAQGV